MNWGIISTVVAVVLGISTLLLTLKLIRKRQPAWAYKTEEIIDLGENSPKELELLYAGKPVRGIYRTTVILFNGGSEIINSEDVTVPIAMTFTGGEILNEPQVKGISNEENKVVVKKQAKSVITKFLYLGHNDGIVFDVLHTAIQTISLKMNIKGVDEVKYKGQFIDFIKGIITKGNLIAMVSGILGVLSLVLFLTINPQWSKAVLDYVSLLIYLLIIIGVIVLLDIVPKYLQSRKFPLWSRGTISKTSIPVSQIEAYCVTCKKRQYMSNVTHIRMKNGKPAVRGECQDCGTKMFRIGDYSS